MDWKNHSCWACSDRTVRKNTMKNLLELGFVIVATLVCACEGAPGRANGTVGARKAMLAAQCVSQGGDPTVETDVVVCAVSNGVRWKAKP